MKETLEIEGMSCNHCVNAVRRALEGMDGVDVGNVEIGSAQVEYDPSTVDRGDVIAAVEKEGYHVKVEA